jgi:hypothetical protein
MELGDMTLICSHIVIMYERAKGVRKTMTLPSVRLCPQNDRMVLSTPSERFLTEASQSLNSPKPSIPQRFDMSPNHRLNEFKRLINKLVII